jgi:C-terminal processing protease CtpA/Prc
LGFPLPGGGSARIVVTRDLLPDGRPLSGNGIQPDIVVYPTIADVVAGRDPALERAVEEIMALR